MFYIHCGVYGGGGEHHGVPGGVLIREMGVLSFFFSMLNHTIILVLVNLSITCSSPPITLYLLCLSENKRINSIMQLCKQVLY